VKASSSTIRRQLPTEKGSLLPRFRPIVLAAALAVLVIAGSAYAATGALTPKGCIADLTFNTDGCGTTAKGLAGAEDVAVSRDGTSVYVAGTDSNAIVRFSRNTTTGALTAKGCTADTGSNPDGCAQTARGLSAAYSIAVSRDGKSVYVVGYSDNAIVRFNRNTTTGALTAKGCIGDVGSNPDSCAKTAKGLSAPDAVAISPDGTSVYVIGSSDNAIAVFSRSTTSGALTPKGCVGDADSNPDGCATTSLALNGPEDLTVSPGGKSVYVAGYGDGAIVRLNRDTTTGALTAKGCIADPSYNPDNCSRTDSGLSEPYAVAVSPDGSSVYIADDGDSAIVRFNRDTATGALTPAGCVADPVNNSEGCAQTASGLDGATSVAVSPDGASVYVTGNGDHALVRFNRGTNGALTPKGCIASTTNNPDGCTTTALGLNDPYGATVSPGGGSVYTAGLADNAIVRFDRAP